MTQLTLEKIEELKAKHAVPMMIVDDSIVFKRPTRAEYDRWADAKVAGGPQTINARQLAQSSLVHPTWDEFMQVLDQRPSLLLNECLDAMIELAGVGGEHAKVTVKKL